MPILPNPWALRRVWATPPEIFRSEMTLTTDYTQTVEGRKFLLRSDFPVLVYFDGGLVGAAGSPYFPPWFRFDYGRVKTQAVNVTFKFPVGWGGNPAFTDPRVIATTGSLVQAEVLGRHGTCCLDAAWSDEMEPHLPDPRFLPPANYGWAEVVAVGAGGFASQYASTAITETGANNFRIGGASGKTPNELFLHTVASHVETLTLAPAVAGQARVYEVIFEKNNLPVGDNQVIAWAEARASIEASQWGAWSQLPFVKVPLRSLLAQWAAETPQINANVFGSPGLGALTSFLVWTRLGGSAIF